MTGISADFEDNPRYQRAVQRMASMAPAHRKVLNTVALDRQFADEGLRRKLYLASLGAEKLGKQRQLQSQRHGLGMARKRFKTQKRFDKESARLGEKQRKWGKKRRRMSDIVGLGGAGLSSWLGYQAYKQGKRKAPTLGAGDVSAASFMGD